MDGCCQTCNDYEAAVMAGDVNSLAPCDDYVMTERFKAWMVDQMRNEVLGQINQSGLNRMTIVKDGQNKD